MCSKAVVLILGVILLSATIVLAGGSEVMLEKIVVTPYRYEESLGKSISGVTVINSKDIENSSASGVVDLLRSVPGIVVRDWYGTGSKSTVDIAGFGEQAALNVLVLVDGRRVNDVDLSGVDWKQVPLNEIEKIEVVRGGSSGVLYGDNASSGVINIITKKGRGALKATLEAAFGSYNMNKQNASLGGESNKLSYWINAGRDSTDGYRKNSYSKNSNFYSKFNYAFNDRASVRFNSGFYASNYGLPGALFQHHIDQYGRRYARYGDDHANGKDYYFLLGSKLDPFKFGVFDADFTYRVKDTDSYFLTSHNNTIRNNIETIGFTPKYKLGTSLFGKENSFITGVDLYRTLYRSTQYTYSDDNDLQNYTHIQKDSLAGYLHDELSVLNQLSLAGGYRYEVARYAFSYHDNNTTAFGHPYPDQDTKIKPKMEAFDAGIVYNYAEDSNAFINIGKSFRFPEIDEFTFQDQNFQQQLNTGLTPQSSINYQAGIRHRFNGNLKADLSVFRMNVKNELYYNPNGGPWGFGQNENYDRTVHEGLEAGLETKLSSALSLFGNYTFTKAFFNKGQYDKNEIPMVPRHKGSVGLRLSLPANITFNMTGTYVGKRYFINDQANALSRLNGYMVADTNITWKHKELSLTFAINNLFDKDYSEYAGYGFDSSTFTNDKYYYPNPGRNFSLKAAYTF